MDGGQAGNTVQYNNDGQKVAVECKNGRYVCDPGRQFKAFTSLWIAFIFLYIFFIWVRLSPRVFACFLAICQRFLWPKCELQLLGE